jgi:hypothetical protein
MENIKLKGKHKLKKNCNTENIKRKKQRLPRVELFNPGPYYVPGLKVLHPSLQAAATWRVFSPD